MGLLNNDLGKKIYILPQGEVVTSTAAPDVVSNEKDIIILSATEVFDKTETASLTSYPISTGATVGDHYKFDNTHISFSGVISGGVSGNFLNPFSYEGVDNEARIISYVSKLRKLMRGDGGVSPLVTIYLPEGNGETNCVITSLKITKDSSVSNGYKVDISAKKLLLATTQFRVVTTDEYELENKQGQDTGVTTQYDRQEVPEFKLIGD